MNRRIAWILALACAVVPVIAPAPAAAQTPVPAQVSPQTVRASIPPQAPTAVPAAASAPSVPRPATAPTPAVAAQPATAVPPIAATAPQARPPVPPQATTPRVEPAPSAKTSSETEAANVRIEVTISYQVNRGTPVKRMATLTVADQGRGSLRAGTQVAVPSTTFQPIAQGGPATNPITSVNYKSVGLNVDANRVYIQGNKARMDLNVEFSAVDEKPSTPAGTFPMFPTFSQSLTLVLESGKSVIVGQSTDVVDNVERTQVVEVKATILR